MQSLTIELERRVRMKRVYISLKTSEEGLKEFMTYYKEKYKGENVLMGAFNARHTSLHRITNTRGRSIIRPTSGSRLKVMQSVQCTYHSGGMAGHNMPDQLITNITGSTTEVTQNDKWEGRLDHTLI